MSHSGSRRDAPPVSRLRSEQAAAAISMLTGSSSMGVTSRRCPICFATPPQDPFATRCGHIFCYDCLRTHLDSRRFCPQCREFTTPESIVPAFLANRRNSSSALPSPSRSVAAATPVVTPLPSPRNPTITTTPSPAAAAATTAATAAAAITVTAAVAANRTSVSTPIVTDDSDRPHVASATQTPKLSDAIASAQRTPDAPNTVSHAAESPAVVNGGDVTPDLTDALSSRRKSPPRIGRVRAAAKQSARSPASRRRTRAAFAAVGAGFSHDASAATSSQPTATAAAASVNNKVPFGVSLAEILENDDIDPEQIGALIAMLEKKKREQAGGQSRMRATLLHDFLRKARSERQETIKRLTAEVDVLNADIQAVKNSRAFTDAAVLVAGSSSSSRTSDIPGLRAKRRRVERNYSSLKDYYFGAVANVQGNDRRTALKKFTDDIIKVTQFNRFRFLASLLHVARDNGSPSNIVSSIEFDRESRLLATAGVTKRIKIFEVPITGQERVGEVHYPVKEISARAKLSWVCWNPYIRQHLVSSDYDGIVTLWDVNQGVPLNEYEEHDKRVWSVDFCTADPRLFASGSDDGRVKIWTTAQSTSAVTIENGSANVCSVKFQPGSTYTLAFGSANHHVHYYDLRYASQALHVFESHERTVSYVKFMSPTELVSACVDSTIKLWDIQSMTLTRTFSGHVNDKNFVGLSVTQDYIACGSEQNSIYAYYKAFPTPFAQYRFPNADPVTGAETQDDDDSFVSSVCWCPKKPTVLVGANSLGTIKVLELADIDPVDDDDDADVVDDDDKSECDADLNAQQSH